MLGLAGDDGRKMEDHLRPPRDRGGGASLRGEIGGNGFNFAGKAIRTQRRHDIYKGEAIDASAAERLMFDQLRNELASDHACRASDEDVHAMWL